MKQNIILILLLSILSIDYSLAQGDNALDAKYSPPTGSIFDDKVVSQNSRNGIRNSITADLGLFARGQGVMGYSRAIGSKGFALSAAIGIPYSMDFIHRAYIVEWVSSSTYNPLNINGFYQLTRFKSAAPLIQGSLKYYVDGDGILEGNFIEATVRRQKEFFDPSHDFYEVIGAKIVTASHTTFYLGYGGTMVGAGKSPFVSNLTFGVGIRTIKIPEFKEFNVIDQFGNTLQEYRQTSGNLRFSNFSLYFTYSLGIGW